MSRLASITGIGLMVQVNSVVVKKNAACHNFKNLSSRINRALKYRFHVVIKKMHEKNTCV